MPAQAALTHSWADLVGVAVGAAATTSHLYSAWIGFSVHRHHFPPARYYTLAILSVAWATAWTTLAALPISREHPDLLVLSSLLSGYGAPALLIFNARAVQPRTRIGAWLMVCGLPGSAFSLLCLLHPDSLAFVAQFRHGAEDGAHRALWHPFVSPLYLGHGITMIGCHLTSGVLLVRGILRARSPEHREALGWLVGAMAVGVFLTLMFTWLPGALGQVEVLRLAPLSTLPVALFALRGVAQLGRTNRPSATEERLRSEVMVNLVRSTAAQILEQLRSARNLNIVISEQTPEVAPQMREIRHHLDLASSDLDRLERFSETRRAGLQIRHFIPELRRIRDGLPPSDQKLVHLELSAEAEACALLGDSALMPETFRALFTNALDAVNVSTHGRVWVRAQREDPAVIPPDALHPELDGTPTVRVEFQDEGDGMTETVLANAPKPFFSTRPRRHGLGLAQAIGGILASGAAFHLESRPGEGTRAVIWLSCAPADNLLTHQRPIPAGVDILQVDADDRRSSLMATLLGRHGARVHRISEGTQALHQLERNREAGAPLPKLVYIEEVGEGPQPTGTAALLPHFIRSGLPIIWVGHSRSQITYTNDPDPQIVKIVRPIETFDLVRLMIGSLAGAHHPGEGKE